LPQNSHKCIEHCADYVEKSQQFVSLAFLLLLLFLFVQNVQTLKIKLLHPLNVPCLVHWLAMDGVWNRKLNGMIQYRMNYDANIRTAVDYNRQQLQATSNI